MQGKQKVTLYLPPELHRQIKVRAALDSETMTDIAQRAIVFYLSHAELVDEFDGSVHGHGHAHNVYKCAECSALSVLKGDQLVALRSQSDVLLDDPLPAVKVKGVSAVGAEVQGEGSLVPC